MMHEKQDPWSTEVRKQAYVAVQVAATRRVATERVLAYMLRKAMSHGLTVDDCCKAGGLTHAEVMRLTDPDTAVA